MPSADVLVIVGTMVGTGLAVGLGLAAVMLRIDARLKRNIEQNRADRRAAATHSGSFPTRQISTRAQIVGVTALEDPK